MSRFILVFTIACMASLFAMPIINSESHERYLLLDDRIIEKVVNAKIVVGTVQKNPSNPLFVEDKPWEKRFDNLYGNVIYDQQEKIYKCWYSPFIVDYSAQGMSLADRAKPYDDDHPKREMGICYAYSKDGISWVKPELGLVEYQGNMNNNLLWRGPHGAVHAGAGVPRRAQRRGRHVAAVPAAVQRATPTTVMGTSKTGGGGGCGDGG